MLILYSDLQTFSVEIVLTLAGTRDHAHNVLFESSMHAHWSIFKFLACDFPYTTRGAYSAFYIYSYPHYLLLTILLYIMYRYVK